MPEKAIYKRILLKISGEVLAGKKDFGLSSSALKQVSEDLKAVKDLGVQVGVVIGGGNIFRGRKAQELSMDRVTCDFMGMLATCINALALQDILEQQGIPTRVMTAVEMSDMAELYIRRRALRHLEKGRLVIFSAGTGNPYFTTDTAASLRAMEINADVLLKATKVDGVFDKDPVKATKTKKFDKISYIDILNKKLKVMDSTAVSLCMDNKMPLIAFNLKEKGNLVKVVCGKKIGTLINK